MKIKICNNTKSDIRLFDSALVECVKNGLPLPDDLSDIFSLEVIEVNGEKRGIVNWA